MRWLLLMLAAAGIALVAALGWRSRGVEPRTERLESAALSEEASRVTATERSDPEPSRSAVPIEPTPDTTPGTAPDTLEVTGRVVDERGGGLGGVAVLLVEPRMWPEVCDLDDLLFDVESVRARARLPYGAGAKAIKVTTETDGAFSALVPRPHTTLVAVAWCEERGLAREEVVPGTLTLLALPRCPRIRGKIADTNGGVVPGGMLSVFREGRATPVVWKGTDAAGGFESPPMSPGTYFVRADADGFESASVPDVHLRLGDPDRVLNLVLREQPAVDVLLTDLAGSPWTAERIGAEVGVRPRQLRFVLSRVENETRLELDVARGSPLEYDEARAHVHGAVTDASHTVLECWLGPLRLGRTRLASLSDPVVAIALGSVDSSTTLRVHVELDESGEGARPETIVRLGDLAGPTGVEFDVVATTMSRQRVVDLRLPAQLTGRRLWIHAMAKGHAEVIMPVALPADASLVEVSVRLPGRAGPLEGRVVDAAGEPVANARVILTTADGEWAGGPSVSASRTGADGRFTYVSVPRAPIRVMARHADLAGTSVAVDARDATQIEVRLSPGREFTPDFSGVDRGYRLRILDRAGAVLDCDRMFRVARHGPRTLRVADAAHTVEIRSLAGDLITPPQPIRVR